MAGRLAQHFIDELLVRTDIVELIGSRLELKPAGRDHAACCPFHDEKTPSFTVSRNKQFYYCFGCGAHGNAIGFLMEHDRLPFREAVAELAGRAGMAMPAEAEPDGPDLRPLYAAMEQVAGFFRQRLRGHADAIAYLKSRGVSGPLAARFGLGYAPADSAALLRFAQQHDLVEPLRTLGLLAQSKQAGGGLYSSLRRRITFPIRDARGRTIGFGARLLEGDGPKYINSSESPIFHKSEALYGLYELQQPARRPARLVVVEGYMDVLLLSEHGITGALATLGTATTPQHVQRLLRTSPNICYCFDGDAAGRRAAWRALENTVGELREGSRVGFLFLPEGDDPDSFVRRHGAAKLEARLDGAQPLAEFLFAALANEIDLSTIDGRAQLIERAQPLIAKVPTAPLRLLLTERLATLAQADPARLTTLMQTQTQAPGPTGPRRTAIRPPATRQGAGGLRRMPLATRLAALLLQWPALCEEERTLELPAVSQARDFELLRQLLDLTLADPQITTGRLLERWRDQPEGARIAALARYELVGSLEQARAEFEAGLEQLMRRAQTERLDALLALKSLDAAQKRELQALLLASRSMAGSGNGKGGESC